MFDRGKENNSIKVAAMNKIEQYNLFFNTIGVDSNLIRLSYIDTINKRSLGSAKKSLTSLYSDESIKKINETAQVFFAVNNCTHKNEFSHSTVLFYEKDDYEILTYPSKREELLERQIQEAFDLGDLLECEPTLIKTFKSVHVYFVLDAPITTPEKWIMYQRRLAQHTKGDKSAGANVNRLLRVPGFNHVREFDNTLCHTPVEVVHISKDKANLDIIESKLPVYDIKRWSPNDRYQKHKKTLNFDMRDIAPYLPGYNPNGRGEWATAKCPNHDGESFDSLHIHNETGAFVCHAGCSSKDVWDSVLSYAINNGFQPPKHYQQLEQNLEAYTIVKDIILNTQDPFIRAAKIEALRRELEIPNAVWTALLDSVEESLSSVDLKHTAEILTSCAKQTLDPYQIFPEKLCNHICDISYNMGHDPSLLTMLFVSYCMPYLQGRHTIDFYNDKTRIDGLVFNHMMIGETGTGKSGLLKVFATPMKNLNDRFFLDFQSDLKLFKTSELVEEPKQRVLWTEATTEASRFDIMSKVKLGGVVLEYDEGTGFFDSVLKPNAYDPNFFQFFLAMYNAERMSKQTKGGGTTSCYMNFSVVGALQPEELKIITQALKKDSRGLLPRFMWSRIKCVDTADLPRIKPRLYDIENLMHKLEMLNPTTLSFTDEALRMLKNIENEISNKCKESNSETLVRFAPKFITQLYRLCGILSIINNTIEDKPIGLITEDECGKAATIIAYFIGNAKILFPDTERETFYVSCLKKGFLYPTDIRGNSNMSITQAADVLSMMANESMGNLEWLGNNKRCKFTPHSYTDPKLSLFVQRVTHLIKVEGFISKDTLLNSCLHSDAEAKHKWFATVVSLLLQNKDITFDATRNGFYLDTQKLRGYAGITSIAEIPMRAANGFLGFPLTEGDEIPMSAANMEANLDLTASEEDFLDDETPPDFEDDDFFPEF